jgi:hypothetical protein
MLSTESQLCMSRVSYVLCQSVIYGEQEDIAQNILADIAPSIIWLYKNELSMSFWMMVFLWKESCLLHLVGILDALCPVATIS